jgi:error-prone DNA polymerase
MGFYSASQLVQDARRHAIEVRAIDVCRSYDDHTLENTRAGPALRLGLRLVDNFGKAAAARVLAARASRPFANIADLRRRAQLNTGELAALIAAGAVEPLSGHRHQAHWQALAIPADMPLTERLQSDESRPTPSGHSKKILSGDTPRVLSEYDDQILLAAPTEAEDIVADHNSTGLSLRRHPMQLLREQFPLFRQCKTHSELNALNQGRFVRVAGLVTGRQRPGTKTGVVFVTLEDETGNINIVVWRDVQLRCREALLKAKLLVIKGIVETDGKVVHVLAGELLDYSAYLATMEVRSRDFH